MNITDVPKDHANYLFSRKLHVKMQQYFLFRCSSLILIPLLGSINCQQEEPAVAEEIITGTEQKLVQQLRQLVKNVTYRDYMKHDDYLVRFLRVSNNDLHVARRKIEQTSAWRKKNRMDSILAEDFSDIDSEFPFTLDGVDNKGRPISIGKVGFTDMRKLIISGKFPKVLRFAEARMELADGIIREMQMASNNTRNVSQLVWISDYSGYNMKQHGCAQCATFFPHLYTIYEQHYPDILSKMITINAPSIFLPAFNLVKKVLSSRTLKRVNLYGGNADEWKTVLMNEIPEDQLPRAYGGRMNTKFLSLTQHLKSNPYARRLAEKAKVKIN